MVLEKLVEVSLETLRACYTCFKCIGVCPAGLRPNLFVKAYLSTVFRELRDVYEEIVTNSSLWSCAKCLKCVEVCPQKVPLNDVIEYLQREAAKRGLAPRAYQDMVENIMGTFLAFGSQTIVSRDGDFYTTGEARELLGLTPLPEPNKIEKFRERLKGLRSIG
ncbi:MAG: 4Fe-4S dicluster domain-containing protein [Ignisphaera sp.]|nr:4Fe-4S dicluster domain-containing protein [Ignisphaera sp.]MDW8085367.1 4Fe-4S dicluster domain-containing protein [Ignisphaera sp.]